MQLPVVVLGWRSVTVVDTWGTYMSKAVCRGKSRLGVIKKISDKTSVKKSSEYALYALDVMAGSTPPFTVNILVNNVPFVMELDTGASLMIMLESTFRCHWPDRQL